jgi:hypothetical protein
LLAGLGHLSTGTSLEESLELPNPFRKIQRLDSHILAEHEAPIDGVFQFTDIARPGIGTEQVERMVAELLPREACTVGIALNEMLDQGWNVLSPVAQWWKGDGDHVDSIVEVQSEESLLNQSMKVSVRGRYETDVDPGRRARTHGAHFAFLENSEEFGLHRQGHVSQLVQEQGPLMCELEDSFAILFGAREGAANVTEELALQERFGEGGAILREERLAGTEAASVDLARDDFFSRAAFTNYQHRELAGCSFSNKSFNASHAG